MVERGQLISTPDIVLEILRGMRGTHDHIHNVLPAGPLCTDVEATGDFVDKNARAKYGFSNVECDKTWRQDLADRDAVAAIEADKSMFTFADGSSAPTKYQFKPSDKDEYTSEELPKAHVRAAIVDELQHVNNRVWEGVTMDEAKHGRDGTILNGRFVTSTKGDVQLPDGRARYVACKINTHDDVSFFAATPPLQ